MAERRIFPSIVLGAVTAYFILAREETWNRHGLGTLAAESQLITLPPLWESIMPDYRFYGLDAKAEIASGEWIHAKSDPPIQEARASSGEGCCRATGRGPAAGYRHFAGEQL